MKLEDLIKLRELLKKNYICASILDKTLDGKIALEKHFKPVSSFEIQHAANNYIAVDFFEELVQNFIRFLKEKNIDDTNFQIYVEPYYYFESSYVTDESGNFTSLVDYQLEEKVLNGVVDLGIYIGANMPNINDKDKDEYLHKFVGTPFKVVNYDEFVSILIEHGYDIKCKSFEELISLDKETSKTDTILLTNINIEPEKILKAMKIS